MAEDCTPNQMSSSSKQSQDGLLVRGPILIDGDYAFIDQEWPGSGTRDDPYRIENLSITAFETAITIRSTTAEFIIRNCHIRGFGIPDVDGILLVSAFDGAIVNCTVSDCSMGIALMTSEADVIGCTLERNEVGINLSNTDRGNVSNNTILDSARTGIAITSFLYMNISDNRMMGPGVLLDPSDLNFWRHRFSRNTVNDRPLVYLSFLSDLVVDVPDVYGESGLGQIILYNCSRVRILGGTLSETSHAVQMAGCTDVTLDGLNISRCHSGLLSYETVDCEVSNSAFYNCSASALSIQWTGGFSVSESSFSHCGLGVSSEYSNYAHINSNEYSRCSTGMESYGGGSMVVEANAFVECDVGMDFSRVHIFDVTNNTFRCSEGLRIDTSHHASISLNRFFGCGIDFENLLYLNSFDMMLNEIDGRPVFFGKWLINTLLDASEYEQVIVAECQSIIITGGAFESVPVGLQAFSCSNLTVSDTVLAFGVTQGLTLVYCEDVTIQNCTFLTCSTGARLLYGPRVEVFDCLFEGCLRGLEIVLTEDVDVHHNTLLECQLSAIEIREFYSAVIRSNTIEDAQSGLVATEGEHSQINSNRISGCQEYAVSLDRCVSLTFGNNEILHSYIGINLDQCVALFFWQNSLTGCGIVLDPQNLDSSNYLDYSNHTFISNTVNGKALRYFLHQDVIVNPDSCGQIVLVGCDSCIIETGALVNASIAIQMVGCEDIVLRYMNLSNHVVCGVQAVLSTDCSLSDVRLEGPQCGGITLFSCERFTVDQCEMDGLGLEIRGEEKVHWNHTIRHTTVAQRENCLSMARFQHLTAGRGSANSSWLDALVSA
jgi:hypothetical protein